MVKIIVAIALLLAPIVVVGSEQVIDLQLKNLSLKEYQYSPAVSEEYQIDFEYQGDTRSYFFYIPQIRRPQMPVLVALHGAGRSGASMIDAWYNTADKYGFVVVAPNGVGHNWQTSVDDIDFIQATVAEALDGEEISATQLYLFGHSNGALKALALAATHPENFTAVVAHAGTLPVFNNRSATDPKVPKPKVGLFLGDNDHIFSVGSARTTMQWLSNSGFSTSLYVMKNHSHWYYEDFDQINDSIWNFMIQL